MNIQEVCSECEHRFHCVTDYESRAMFNIKSLETYLYLVRTTPNMGEQFLYSSRCVETLILLLDDLERSCGAKMVSLVYNTLKLNKYLCYITEDNARNSVD